MQKYMVQVAYAPSAVAALVAKPQERAAAVKTLIEAAGGTFVSMDFCFGEYDLVTIAEVPDEATMAAISLAVTAQGHCKALHTTKLISPADFLTAQQKAHALAQKMSYAAPAKG